MIASGRAVTEKMVRVKMDGTTLYTGFRTEWGRVLVVKVIKVG